MESALGTALGALGDASTCKGFPGPEHLHPKIHYTRDEVSCRGGWHDIAGALTHRGVHHVYQGTGWNEAHSSDLVSWRAGEHGPKAIHETHAGMDSDSE